MHLIQKQDWSQTYAAYLVVILLETFQRWARKLSGTAFDWKMRGIKNGWYKLWSVKCGASKTKDTFHELAYLGCLFCLRGARTSWSYIEGGHAVATKLYGLFITATSVSHYAVWCIPGLLVISLSAPADKLLVEPFVVKARRRAAPLCATLPISSQFACTTFEWQTLNMYPVTSRIKNASSLARYSLTYYILTALSSIPVTPSFFLTTKLLFMNFKIRSSLHILDI